MLNTPDNVTAQKRGLFSLVNVRLPYQGVGVSTTRAFIRDNSDIVRRYIKSQIEAVHRIKTDRDAGIKVLAKYLASPDKEILERTMTTSAVTKKFRQNNIPLSRGSKTF
jgi:hypothetical protein